MLVTAGRFTRRSARALLTLRTSPLIRPWQLYRTTSFTYEWCVLPPVYVIQYFAHWKREWISMAFFGLKQESFQSHLNLLISSLQATHKPSTCTRVLMMVCEACRQTAQCQKNTAYGNRIKFHITAKQAIRYAILANVMVNHLYSTDGFFLNKAP